MLIVDFFQWWYSSGWILRAKLLVSNVSSTANFYSVGTLLTTLFSPWRQIITTTRADQGLDVKSSALLDNLISRFVGFFVRMFVLIAALITVLFVFVFNLALIIAWPAIPLLPVIFIVLGVA